jgi:ketosteroid isomerase-like protein
MTAGTAMKTLMLLNLLLLARPLGAAESPRVLIDREHDFARSVAEKGIGPGFVEFLAPKAYIFRPRPVPGRSWHATNRSPGRLLWEPERAVISAAGDVGYTTGPWKYFADEQGREVVAGGHYLSVWKKQPDGRWQVEADIGIPHEPRSLEGIQPSLRTLAVRPAGSPAGDPAGSLEAGRLGRFDRETSPPTTEGVTVYRPNKLPWSGREAVARAWKEFGVLKNARAIRTMVSADGTLACTLGTGRTVTGSGESGTEVEASYLRIWERGDGEDWKLSAEVVLPWPPNPP